MSELINKKDPLLIHFNTDFYNDTMLRICNPYLRLAKSIISTTKPSFERTKTLERLLEARDWQIRGHKI
jgi:hypothetical protein